MHTKTSRFTEKVVSLAEKAVVGTPAPAYRPGEEGYADWVILAIQGLKEYQYFTKPLVEKSAC